MITDIRYTAVMVEDLEEGIKLWRDFFGLEPLNEVRTNQFGIKAQMLGVNGQPVIEVMTPANKDTALARMMEERKNPRNPNGEGIYMIAVEVDDIEATIKQIQSKGGRVMREEGNSNVAWVHPVGLKMVFVELQQKGTGSMGAAGQGRRQ
jgi:methylmalonyl-CoA epimerase